MNLKELRHIIAEEIQNISNEGKDIAKKFEVGKSYGNDLVVKILSRTDKSVRIETQAFGERQIKIKSYHQNGTESISFKAWLIAADELA